VGENEEIVSEKRRESSVREGSDNLLYGGTRNMVKPRNIRLSLRVCIATSVFGWSTHPKWVLRLLLIVNIVKNASHFDC